MKDLAIFREYGPKDKIPPLLFPFKNRWFRLVLFVWACLFTSNVLLGWQPISAILLRSGAYEWQCAEPATEKGQVACDAQYSSVQTLYTIFVASQYACTLVAGVLYDNLGPMRTAYLGEGLHFLGWLFLAYSSKSVQLDIPAAFLIGGSINIAMFPTLTIAHIFPRYAALATSFIVALQGASTAIGIPLDYVWKANPAWSYAQLMSLFTFAFVLPAVILYPIACPYSRFDAIAANPLPTDHEAKGVEEGETEMTKQRDTSKSADDTGLTNGKDIIEYKLPPQERSSSESFTIIPEDQQDTKLHDGTDFKQLMKELSSIQFIIFTIWYIIEVMIASYYPTTIRAYFGKKESELLGYVQPLHAVAGTIIGIPVQKTGSTLPTAFVVAVALNIVFFLTKDGAVQYVGLVLYVVSQAYVYITKYTYFAEIFPPRNYGIIVGLAGSLAGVFTYLNIPIVSHVSYRNGFIMYIVIGWCNLLFLVFLMTYGMCAKKRKGKETAAIVDSTASDTQQVN